MINIPRALFESRTGRQPIYHIGIDERQDWAYGGERLVPLKGYPGVVWTRPRKKKRNRAALICDLVASAFAVAIALNYLPPGASECLSSNNGPVEKTPCST